MTFRDTELIVSGMMEKGRYWMMEYDRHHHSNQDVVTECRIYCADSIGTVAINVRAPNWDVALTKFKEELGILQPSPAPDEEIDNCGFYVDTTGKEAA
jgi:hypothetical protein